MNKLVIIGNVYFETDKKDVLDAIDELFDLVSKSGIPIDIDITHETYLLDKEGDLSKPDKPMVEKIKDKIEYVFDKANDYERIKEKLIGETFEYAPQISYIINGLLMRYESNPELIRFLREHTNLITNTFIKSGTRNLRILKHALNDFKKVFENVCKFYPNTSLRVLQTMLIFTILATILPSR